MLTSMIHDLVSMYRYKKEGRRCKREREREWEQDAGRITYTLIREREINKKRAKSRNNENIPTLSNVILFFHIYMYNMYDY